jgi:hypothetical protein
VQLKTQAAIKKGANLKHVSAPTAGLSDAQKAGKFLSIFSILFSNP